MANFRNVVFAAAIAVVALGFQGTASAQGFGNAPQFTCVANAGVPPIVRSEGVTELVGDLILNCQGGTPTPAGVSIPQSNIQIFLNTNVTSRLLNSANLSEATMLIDEPYPSANANPTTAPGVANAPTVQSACQAVNSTNCSMLGVGATGLAGGATTIGPLGINGPYRGTSYSPTLTTTSNSYNVFQGFQNGVNSIAWLGVPIDSPGSNYLQQLNTRVIRITNVRANACLLGVSSTLIPTQIVMFISVNGSQQVTINNPQQTVGYIQPGLTAGTRTANYLQCNNLNAAFVTAGGTTSGVVSGPIYMTATEGFASSFKPRHYAQVVSPLAQVPDSPAVYQNVPGFSYNSESGFVANPVGGIGFGLGTGAVGLSDTGTQIAFNFAGVGTGVSVFVPTVVYLYPSGVSAALPTSAAGTGATGVAVLVGGANGTTYASATFGSATYASVNSVAIYEVLGSNPNVLEQMVVPVVAAFISNTTNNLPALGQTTVSINFAPLSTVPTASTSSAPIPRFCQPYPVRNIFAVNICSCNLLFPFVTNQAGFDTGIAIANTSLDPFGTATQAGTVKLNYYGNTTGGGAAPAAQTSQTVVAGNELVFTLSNGGNLGITATPGFQGYIIAQAQFQYCHAFAFISDLGAQKLAEGYLGIQLDVYSGSGLNRTGVIGEVQGH